MKLFRIEKAYEKDVDAVAELIQTVWEQMERKEWFVADNADYTRSILRAGKGMVYKAVEEKTGIMAAVFMVSLPGDGKENLGRDIGLPEEELNRVAHMESMAILPEHRGNHLQYRMMMAAEEELRALGYGYLMCTVHPDNQYSRNNILKQGYEVVMTKEKYGGYLRDILLKKLS